MPNPFANHVAGLSVAPSSRLAAEWAACAPAVRAGSFFMACVEDEHLLQSIRDLAAQALEEGWSQQEWVYQARAMLRTIKDAAGLPYNKADERAAWSEEERRRYENDVRQLDSIARLKLILRTQSRLASGYREFRQAFEPFWLENYPGWRFVRQPGAKTKRPDHVEHENEVRLKTDTAFWLARNSPEQGGFGNPYPPFGFNSWCWVEPVGRKECEELGLLAPGQKLEAPDGEKLSQWDLPRLLQQRAEASTEGLSGESIRRIGERCRERGFEVEHDAAKGLLRAVLPGLRKGGGGSFAASGGGEIPAPPTGLSVPEALYRMLAKRKEPKRKDYKTEKEWRAAHEAWRKRWGMPREGEEDGVQAAHCNQYGHVPGCSRGNGVDKPPSAGWRGAVLTKEEAKPILRAYKEEKMRKAQAHAKQVLPRNVATPLKDVPEAVITGSDIKEMLAPKAVYASIRNGVMPEIHVEGVLRTPDLIAESREVSRRPGGKKDKVVIKRGKEIAVKDPIAEIIEVESTFTGGDRKNYTACYSVQKYKQAKMLPKIYFLECRKRK